MGGEYLSLGAVIEDDSKVLSKLNRSYCDDDSRPYADMYRQSAGDTRSVRRSEGEGRAAYEEGVGGATSTNDADDDDDIDVDVDDDGGSDADLVKGYPLAPNSPSYDRPPEEVVPMRIPANDATLFATAGWDDDANDDDDDDDDGEDEDARQIRIELHERQEEEYRRRKDDSRAVVLEMLGDRPTAEVMAPEDVLFVCKLNPLTTDDDLELIFARFDSIRMRGRR